MGHEWTSNDLLRVRICERFGSADFSHTTPDKMFFGTGDEICEELAKARDIARVRRIEENRATHCGACAGAESSVALLLQRPRSRML